MGSDFGKVQRGQAHRRGHRGVDRKEDAGHADAATNTPIRVLLVEDSCTDAELVIRELKRAGHRADHRIVETEEAFRNELTEFMPDVILSDFSMPRFDGMDALRLARDLCPDVPFIFVSGTIGEEYAIRALKNGATDYVLKTNLVRLPAAVERALQDARERAAKREIERALQQNEAGLRRAQLMAGLAHVITAPDGSFESWSETLPRLIGADDAGMPRSTREWLDILHPEDRPKFRAQAIDAGIRGTRTDVEYRLRRLDGAWINVRQVMEPLEEQANASGKWRWFNTIQDVTEQKRAEAALREGEVKFRGLIEQAADGIFVTDEKADFLLVNSRYCEMLGYSEDELLGLNVADTYPEEEREHLAQRIAQLSEVKNMQCKASASELRSEAIRSGMATLRQDGIEKCLFGRTDLREVRAVAS